MTSRFILTGSAAFLLLSLSAHAQFSPSPNPINSSVTGARTLTGGTGSVTSTGTLTVTGSTAAVTMSGGTIGTPTTLSNSGTIQQTGTGRAVVSASTGAVLVIQNNAGATISSANNDTVAAGTGSTTVSSVALTNAGTITSAAGGQAVNFNKILTAPNSIANSGSIFAAGSDAIRPGVNGTVTNSGTIKSTQVSGSSSDGVDLQTNTGIQVTNNANGLVEGGRHGVTGGPADGNTAFNLTVTNNAGATIQGDNGSGINIDGFNANQTATVVNHGTITGNGITGDGDGLDVDGLVNVTNTGTIRSLNSVNATTPAQSEGLSVGGGTITNSGTIEGLVAPGNTNAVGRGISLLGNDLTTGPLAGTREAIYGNATVTNQAGGLIRGDSDSGIVVEGPASGFTVTVTNQAGATIQGGGTANAALRTGSDNDTVNNAGTINGSTSGKAIDLGAGNDTLNITGGTATIHGNVSGGAGTNTAMLDPGASSAFSYSGSLSNFSTVEVKSGTVTLSGVNDYTGTTKLTGGRLLLAGVNRLNASSSLLLNGGTLEISAGVVVNGLTLGSLTLGDNSILDLDSSAVTFNGFGGYTAGKTLSIVDYSAASSPTFALRFLGDFTTDPSLIALKNATTINGLGAVFAFDGTYTNVIAAVPEPTTALVGVALLGLAGSRNRRRRVQS